MLKPIEAAKVMRRMHQVIESHNAKCELVTHTRTAKDGRTKTVTRRAGIIREQVITSFHAILSAYIESYNRTASLMPAGMYTCQDPPSLLTNCVRLSGSCKATDRTVRNHIGLLVDLGMVNTKWHGNRKNFELWITPEILFSQADLETAKNDEKTPVPPPQRKNFPHNPIQGQIIETEKRKADLCVIDTERTNTEREVGQNTFLYSPQAPQGSPLAPAGTEESAGPPRRIPRLPEVLSQLHARLLMQFWLYAWKVIYPNREFDLEQQEKALTAIYVGVYGEFSEDRSEEKWIELHTYQLEKVDKAARYYDMHPDRYPGDPYSVYVKGRGYFDRENVTGFVGIDSWMKREKVQKAHNKAAYQEKREKLEERLYGLLRQARRDFEKFHAGKPMRKQVQHLSEIGLFQYHNAFFKGFGRKWADLFCRQWQIQKQDGFRAPKYYQPARERRKAGETLETVVYVEPWMEGDGEGYYVDL